MAKMTKEQFIAKYALGPGGTFLADDKGGNSASEVAGQNVADYYDKYLGPNATTTRQAGWDGDQVPIQWGGGIDRRTGQYVNLDAWSNVDPHPESTSKSGWDSLLDIARPAAGLAALYFGGGALANAFGGAAAGGVAGGVGATEGALGLASTSPVVGGTAGVTATDLGAIGGAGAAAGGGYGALGSGTYGLGGSLTTGAYPGSVLAADSVIAPTTMDTIMSGAGVGAGTLGGATDATGALIGNGTAAAGAASMTVPASGGGFGSGLVDWLKENPTLATIGMGLLGAKASGNTTTSASKDPWAPAQPYLLQNLAQNQAMSNQYNANPFSNEQKAAYQGLLNTVANSQAAGNGLLGMASNFGKSSRGVIPQSAALPTGVTAPAIDWSQYANFGGKR